MQYHALHSVLAAYTGVLPVVDGVVQYHQHFDRVILTIHRFSFFSSLFSLFSSIRSFSCISSRHLTLYIHSLRAKLHYTDTGYGHVVQHHQRTPPTDELTTILQQICHIAMPKPNISTCPHVGMWQIFVRWWCS